MARINRRCRGGCGRRLGWSEWVTHKKCQRCLKRLTTPVTTVEKSGGLTIFDAGAFGHRAGLMANSAAATYGKFTPKVWEGAADADLDAIRRRHDPTPEESYEDAEAARRDAVLAYAMNPDQLALASALNAH
jgi:hypothetical protein